MDGSTVAVFASSSQRLPGRAMKPRPGRDGVLVEMGIAGATGATWRDLEPSENPLPPESA